MTTTSSPSTTISVPEAVFTQQEQLALAGWSGSQTCCAGTTWSICRWSCWRVLRNIVKNTIVPSGLHQLP